MQHVARSWIAFALLIAGCANEVGEGRSSTTRASEGGLRYRERDLPGPFVFYAEWAPKALGDDGNVYGYASGPEDAVKLDAADQLTIVAHGFVVNVANDQAIFGGCEPLPSSRETPRSSAALVLADGSVETLPPFAGELRSCVQYVSQGGEVLAFSDNSSGSTEYVTVDGTEYPIVLDDSGLPSPNRYPSWVGVNDHGQVAGDFNTACGGLIAFRYDALTQVTTPLLPLPGDVSSRANAISESGEVFGYSYTDRGVEHIGRWNARGEFTTLFTEGNTQFPTRSDGFVVNESGLIVLSNTSDGHTYLIPEAGERVDLATLVTNETPPSGLVVVGINAHGDFLAVSYPLGLDHYVFLRDDSDGGAAL